jgi:replicative DNA helicase
MEKINRIVHNIFNKIEDRHLESHLALLESRALSGLSFGISSFDKSIGGIPHGGVTFILGPADSGKTLLLLHILTHSVINQKKTALLFSCATRASILGERMLCSVGNFDLDRTIKGRFPNKIWPDISSTCMRLSETSLFLEDNDGHGFTPVMIEERIENLRTELAAKKQKLDLIFIDGFEQLEEGESLNNSEYVSRLRAIAIKHNMAIILSSRIGRVCRNVHKKKHCTRAELSESHATVYLAWIQHEPVLHASLYYGNYSSCGVLSVPFDPKTGRIL